MAAAPYHDTYRGRFAPSPTGDLHFGSLIAAVGSFLQARSKKGKWLVRMEDIDPPREVAGSAEKIITDLQRFGMTPDEPVLFQSSRRQIYLNSCRALLDRKSAFRCTCSRKNIPASGIYPGTCRNRKPPRQEPTSIRMKVDGQVISFNDAVMGRRRQNIGHDVGDFVIHRSDGLPAYQLAVVVDDAFQTITEVVRGADLLDSTPRQIFLQQILGLPTPNYLHLPVATDRNGRKLGKRIGSDPVNRANPAYAVYQVLCFLGQHPPARLELEALWRWAIDHWDTRLIPRAEKLEASGDILGS